MDVYPVASTSIHFLFIVFLCSLLPQMAYVPQGKLTYTAQWWPKAGLNQSATPNCLSESVSRKALRFSVEGCIFYWKLQRNQNKQTKNLSS